MRPVRRTDNLATFMCRLPQVLKPQPPGALGTHLGLYRDSFTFTYITRLNTQRTVLQYTNTAERNIFFYILCIKRQYRQCTYSVTLRRHRESLLPRKNNKYYLLVCVCVHVGTLARGRVHAQKCM